MSDVKATFRHFNLPQPTLVKSHSTDPAAVEHTRSRRGDLIYVDAYHGYAVALADFQLCRSQLAPTGILAMDDASLETSFRPPPFSLAVHRVSPLSTLRVKCVYSRPLVN